jgi:NAD(P)-dependent dehydrogenase (short-subunit alcohol dehydrogenase family)
MYFQEKVIIVSGGASGIGKATTTILGEAGANVVLADIDSDASARVAGAIGSNVIPETTDLRSLTSIEDLVGRTHNRFGRIDGLANIAAVFPFTPFLETTAEVWQRIDETNLRGSYFLGLSVAKTMIQEKTHGAIVNVASGAAYRPVEGMAAYSASKGGVVAMTRTMAHELAPHHIRVNVVAPGHTASDTVRRSRSEADLQDAASSLLSRRWMEPEEVARVVVFLLGDLSRAMTGAAVNVNGGNYMPH